MHAAPEGQVLRRPGPLGLKLHRIREGRRIAARQRRSEAQQGPFRKNNSLIFDIRRQQAIRRRDCGVPENLIDHFAAIGLIRGASLPHLRMLQHRVHREGEHILRRVVPGEEQHHQHEPQFGLVEVTRVLEGNECVDQ